MSNITDETNSRTEATSPITTATAPATSPRERLPAILFGVGMLVLGLIGGWLMAGDGDDSGTWGREVDDATLAQIDELLDDYWTAWDAGDGEAVVALMETGGWFSSPYTVQPITGAMFAASVNSYDELELTRVGPTAVIESPAGYEVSSVSQAARSSRRPESCGG